MQNKNIFYYINILALDAPMIGVSWYIYFSKYSNDSYFNNLNCLILFTSIWLGYALDRLLDVRSRKIAELFSSRHKFCKNNEIILWKIWTLVFIFTIFLCLFTLNSENIFAGLVIVSIIALYNIVNQRFSNRGLPKEICVALIFSYGTNFFIEAPNKSINVINFGLLCFINCIIIAYKDKYEDRKAKFISWAHQLDSLTILIFITVSCIYFYISIGEIINPLLLTCLGCLALYSLSNYLSSAQFRLSTETIYILIPLLNIPFQN